MPKNLSLIFISLLFSASLAHAQALCEVLKKGQLPLDKEVQTLRILDQGKNGNCWLHAYSGYLEGLRYLKTGEQTQISVAHLFRQSILLEAEEIYQRSWTRWGMRGDGEISIGDFPSTGDHIIRTYGLLPESAWTPKIPHSQWPGEDMAQAVTQILRESKANGLVFNAAMKAVNDYLDSITGPMPQSFIYKDKTYTPETFATEYMSFLGNKLIHIDRTVQMEFLEPRSRRGRVIEDRKEAERFVMSKIDSGEPVIFSYEFARPLHKNGPVLGTDYMVDSYKYEGRHAVVVVGYVKDLDGRVLAWKIQNSWGSLAGLNGFFFMSREFFERFVYSIGSYQEESN